MRRLLSLILILLLSFTTVACSSVPNNSVQNPALPKNTRTSRSLAPGRYAVQQVTYDDTSGIYTLMLLDTPPGQPSSFQTENLRMARLSEEEIKRGEKTAVVIEGQEAELYLTEDFKIEYLHTVTETQTNPQTGQPQTVVVRQESNFWAPFAGAIAGQALGSMLFRPQYYLPPVYSGAPLTGFGGYGASYGQAVESYRSRNQTAPPVAKNRQTFRTSGNVRQSPASGNLTTRRSAQDASKSSGSGFGSSRLGSSGSSKARTSTKSFGSSRSSSRSYSRSGGGRRR